MAQQKEPPVQPQRTQSAEEWLAARGLADLRLHWPVSKPKSSRPQLMSLTGLMEAYAHSLKQAAAPTEPFADPSKEELKAAPIEIGWLIEKIVDDRPQWLTCAWTFGWTDDAGNAIRFCRRDDAEQIATMMENDDIRITEHQWS